MQISDKAKYVRELKKTLNEALKFPQAVAQVHLVGDSVVVDVRVKYRNLQKSQRVDLTYHDCYALPNEYTYGCAVVQASIIKGCFNAFLETATMD